MQKISALAQMRAMLKNSPLQPGSKYKLDIFGIERTLLVVHVLKISLQSCKCLIFHDLANSVVEMSVFSQLLTLFKN